MKRMEAIPLIRDGGHNHPKGFCGRVGGEGGGQALFFNAQVQAHHNWGPKPYQPIDWDFTGQCILPYESVCGGLGAMTVDDKAFDS